MADKQFVTVRNPKTGAVKKVEKKLAKEYAIAGWTVVEENYNNYTKYPFNK